MIIIRNTIMLTDEQENDLEYLKDVAMRKKFYAEFVVNLYNDTFKCNIFACARYIRGESDDKLKKAFDLMLDLAMQGIESQEYLGRDFIKSLIKFYELRES
ncbi:hypothetical protein [Xenorhabdus koppenhoeferi]|uniref:Uncharacterized protein n=1 Tax=Xenorhabdus koppenhoeferi TaxID=351659 RepID=A0A1I7H5Y0_9GAMM|nr:hypothetical protein [Xenorhabdus koppenhoeferi]CEE91457.1 conserved hypothetical protein [Xenorhabdus nematophila str. Anatoliense]SFU56123.1 hypothetical protein SAMN05421784_11186 [Xenorhabdus koppenhoeferi]